MSFLPPRPCGKCGTSTTRRCGKCFDVRYCSEECQHADWKKHGKICCTPRMIKRRDGTEALDMHMNFVPNPKDKTIKVFPMVSWTTDEEEVHFFGEFTSIDPRPLDVNKFNEFVLSVGSRRRIAYAHEKFDEWAKEFESTMKLRHSNVTAVVFNTHFVFAYPYPA